MSARWPRPSSERCGSRGEGPLCLAVDDVQWLDAASLSALRYALAGSTTSGRRTAGGAGRRSRVVSPCGPRGPTARRRVRRAEPWRDTRAPARPPRQTFPRPTLIKLWETRGGNPSSRSSSRRAPAPRRNAQGRRGAPDSDRSSTSSLRVRLEGSEPLRSTSQHRRGARRSDGVLGGVGGRPRLRGGLAEAFAPGILERRRGSPAIHPSAARIGGRRARVAVAPAVPARAARRSRSDPGGTGSPPSARDGRAESRRPPRSSRRHRRRLERAARRPRPPTWRSRRSG